MDGQLLKKRSKKKGTRHYNPITINPVIEMCEGVLSNKEIKDLTKGDIIKEGFVLVQRELEFSMF